MFLNNFFEFVFAGYGLVLMMMMMMMPIALKCTENAQWQKTGS